jgi:peptide/nickel transport system substrate-binding protein
MLLPRLELRAEVSGEIEPAYGGVLHLGTHSKAGSLNPLAFPESIAVPLRDMLFNKLVRINSRSEFEPDLAERWEISIDRRIYTFYLRPGVFFHDGADLTSADVLHTFRLFSRKETSPVFSHHFEMVKEWKAPGRYIFQAVLNEPYPMFLWSVWQAYMISERAKPGDAVPPGTGPFIFDSQQESGEIRLKANPRYYENRPYVDAVEFHIMPSKDHLWSSFVRGGADMTFFLDRPNYLQIRDNPSFHAFKSLTLGTAYILLFNFKDPLIGDPRVREAISLAIDRREILERLEENEGVITEGPFHPDSSAEGSNEITLSCDPRRARKLVREIAGAGKELTLHLLIDQRSEHLMRMAKLLRQQLQETGIRLRFHYFSNQKQLSEVMSGDAGAFQCYLLVHGLPPVSDILNQWHSASPANIGHYSSGAMDEVVDRMLSENDPARKKVFYNQIRQIFLKDKPALFLYVPYVFHGASSKVGNAEALAGPFTPFRRIKDIFKVQDKPKEGG